MVSKELFQTIEDNLKINDEYKEEIEALTNRIVDYLKENNINFSNNTNAGFVSHVVALLQRIKNSEKLESIGEDVLTQIDPVCVQKAKDALNIIEKEKNVQLNESEIALAAIHIQNALQEANS